MRSPLSEAERARSRYCTCVRCHSDAPAGLDWVRLLRAGADLRRSGRPLLLLKSSSPLIRVCGFIGTPGSGRQEGCRWGRPRDPRIQGGSRCSSACRSPAAIASDRILLYIIVLDAVTGFHLFRVARMGPVSVLPTTTRLRSLVRRRAIGGGSRAHDRRAAQVAYRVGDRCIQVVIPERSTATRNRWDRTQNSR